MSKTIYLKLGTANQIALADFIDSLDDFKNILLELDATISHDKDGNMIWEVVTLEKTTRTLVGVAPRLKRGREDVSLYVEKQFIENTRLLSTRGERTEYLSDRGLKKLQSLSSRSNRLGPLEVYLNGNGPITDQVAISDSTYQNAKQLTTSTYTEFGSIFGSLDSISVHKGAEFRVWNEENNKSVRCRFNFDEIDRVKSYLKEKVIVTGDISFNAAHKPLSIVVESLEPAPKLVVPTIDEIIGLVPNMTEGLSLKEYMERLSNE